jgi:hypothetical protein
MDHADATIAEFVGQQLYRLDEIAPRDLGASVMPLLHFFQAYIHTRFTSLADIEAAETRGVQECDRTAYLQSMAHGPCICGAPTLCAPFMPAASERLPIDQDWERYEADYATSACCILGCTNTIRGNAIFCFTCISNDILCFTPQTWWHSRTQRCAGGPSAGERCYNHRRGCTVTRHSPIARDIGHSSASLSGGALMEYRNAFCIGMYRIVTTQWARVQQAEAALAASEGRPFEPNNPRARKLLAAFPMHEGVRGTPCYELPRAPCPSSAAPLHTAHTTRAAVDLAARTARETRPSIAPARDAWQAYPAACKPLSIDRVWPPLRSARGAELLEVAAGHEATHDGTAATAAHTRKGGKHRRGRHNKLAKAPQNAHGEPGHAESEGAAETEGAVEMEGPRRLALTDADPITGPSKLGFTLVIPPPDRDGRVAHRPSTQQIRAFHHPKLATTRGTQPRQPPVRIRLPHEPTPPSHLC